MYSSPRGGWSSSAIHPSGLKINNNNVPATPIYADGSQCKCSTPTSQGCRAISGHHYLSWMQSCSWCLSFPSQPHWHAALCCTTSACFMSLALIHSHIHPSPQPASLSCPSPGASALPAIILKCYGSLGLSGSHSWHRGLKKPWLKLQKMPTGFCVVSPKQFNVLFLERRCVEENLWIPSTGVSVICFTKCLTKLSPRQEDRILLLLWRWWHLQLSRLPQTVAFRS